MRKLEDLEIYQLSMKISDRIWQEVNNWDDFAKHTFGKQLIRSSDSISANIAEGYGRNSTKEVLQFCYYSRGSLKESSCFLQKASSRNMLASEQFQMLQDEMELLGKKLNRYINYLKESLQAD